MVQCADNTLQIHTTTLTKAEIMYIYRSLIFINSYYILREYILNVVNQSRDICSSGMAVTCRRFGSTLQLHLKGSNSTLGGATERLS